MFRQKERRQQAVDPEQTGAREHDLLGRHADQPLVTPRRELGVRVNRAIAGSPLYKPEDEMQVHRIPHVSIHEEYHVASLWKCQSPIHHQHPIKDLEAKKDIVLVRRHRLGKDDGKEEE